MHLTGLVGMPRRVYTYPEGLGWEWLNLASPTSHAYYAVTTFLLGYLALHALLAAAMAGFSLLRWRHGFISPRRSLGLRVPRLWPGYTAVVSSIGLGLVHGLPGLLGGV